MSGQRPRDVRDPAGAACKPDSNPTAIPDLSPEAPVRSDEGHASQGGREGLGQPEGVKRYEDEYQAPATMTRVLLLLVLVLGAAIGLYSIPSSGSFGIQAVTGGAVVEHTGTQAGRWILVRPHVCNRLPPGARRPVAADEAPSPCPASLFEVSNPQEADFVWPRGAITRIRSTTRGGLAVEIEALGSTPLRIGDVDLRAGSRIIVAPQDWRAHAALPVAGLVTVGILPVAGEEGYLRSGRYIVREPLIWRSDPVTAVSGELFAGDEVSFEVWSEMDASASSPEGDAPEEGAVAFGGIGSGGDWQYRPAIAIGFIAPHVTQHRGEQGFSIIAYTSKGLNRMRISRLGTDPSYVEVRWTDRVMRDPVLLAVAVILGILAVFLPFAPLHRILRQRWPSGRR
jgi:hypothetical protein